jgi:phosphoglycerol transferase
MSFLGGFASIGFLGLLVVGLGTIFGSGSSAATLDRRLAGLVLICLLLGVSGGFSWVLGLSGFTQIRAWNRISIFISFFSVTATALWLDRLLVRLRLRGPVTWVVALTLIAVGVLDQTSTAIVSDPRPIAAEYGSDRRFVRALEAELGQGAAVYQLPFVPYPEAGGELRGKMLDYDHFRGFIHSRSLKWSYGGMRGRESEWQRALQDQPLAAQMDAAAAVGFRAVYVDRFGYDQDGGAFEGELGALLGPPLLESDNQRLVAYDLRPLRALLSQRLGDDAVADLRQRTLRLPPS